MKRAAADAGTAELGVRTVVTVTHVPHYRHDGRLFAYGPYAREIAIWADLFPRVVIAAPYKMQPPPGDCLALPDANIVVSPQPETGGTTLGAKLAQLALLPYAVWRLARAMAGADAIHVRCPGNLGLLGALMSPLFARRRIAKYAGQWSAYPGEPRTVRLQRAILGSRWWGAPVLVYAGGTNQPSHVVPFFTSILTAPQMERARRAAASRVFGQPLRIAYVGRLTAPKNVDVLLTSVAALRQRGVDVECTVVGDGPERRALETLAATLHVSDRVRFTGPLEFDDVLDRYEQADVMVLPSSTEGWPKAIAEAMAFGLVCIGPDRGIVPEMLGDGRGIVVTPGDGAALTEALVRIARTPAEYRHVQARAAEWAQQFTLERFGVALRDVLHRYWLAPAEQVHVGAVHA